MAASMVNHHDARDLVCSAQFTESLFSLVPSKGTQSADHGLCKIAARPGEAFGDLLAMVLAKTLCLHIPTPQPATTH